MTSLLRIWLRIPDTLRAVLVGLIVTAAGSAPWQLLSLINVRMSPHVPWAGPLMAAWLWGYWRYLSGHGPPHATAVLRRERLQIRSLSASTWRWALLATSSGFAALIVFAMAVSRFAPMRLVDVSDPDRYPLALVLTGLVMTAVVAAVTEEAGFRGYMQSMLDQRLGSVSSTVLVATIFALIHLSHGFALQRLLINAAASVILSLTARRTGSIRPGIVVHAASDILVPAYAWARRRAALPHAVQPHGVDTFFVAQCAIAVAFVALTLWAYRRLDATQRGWADPVRLV